MKISSQGNRAEGWGYGINKERALKLKNSSVDTAERPYWANIESVGQRNFWNKNPGEDSAHGRIKVSLGRVFDHRNNPEIVHWQALLPNM